MLFAFFRFDGDFDRADQDMSVAAFEPRHTLHCAKRCQVFGKPHKQFLAQVSMRDLASRNCTTAFTRLPSLRKRIAWFFLKS